MTLKIGALIKVGLFFPVVCFISVFDQTLAKQLYRDKGLLTCFLYFRSKSSSRIPRFVSKYDPVISFPTSQSIRATVAASFFLGQGLFSVLLHLRSFWQTSLWRDLPLRQINNAGVRSMRLQWRTKRNELVREHRSGVYYNDYDFLVVCACGATFKRGCKVEVSSNCLV